MFDCTVEVVIRDGELLEAAVSFLGETEEAARQWEEFAELSGGYAVAPNFSGLLFDGKSPEGWTKKEGRSGFSRPKPGTDAAILMSLLPRPPKAWDLFGERLVWEIAYEAEGKETVMPVCQLWDGPEVFIKDGRIHAVIPDAASAASLLVAMKPGAVITNNAGNWQLPQDMEIA